MILIRMSLCLLLVLLSACATVPELAQPIPTEVAACQTFYQQLDRAVSKAHVRDVQSAPIKGFPYLYTNRFLSSFRQQNMTKHEFKFWLDQLQALGQETWEIQSANLPPMMQQELKTNMPNSLPKTLPDALQYCAKTLRQYDFQQSERYDQVKQNAITPDSYSTLARTLGLYPITKHAMYWAHNRSRKKFTQAYLTRLESLPVKGKLIRYIPPKASPSTQREIEALIKLSSLNPLKIPLPTGAEYDRLFSVFAPIWEVDVAHRRDDHIGRPIWPSMLDLPDVDPNDVVIYRKIAHTRFNHQILLQLVYTAWFPARTKHKRIDIEEGRFSGVMWRVTLKPNGEVLLYDSAHSCACYHMFYPVAPELQLGAYPKDPAEAVFQPQRNTEFPPDQRLVLRIAHLTHHLHRVYPVTAHKSKAKHNIRYDFDDYDSLRSLPYANYRRSLFDENGMIPGSERLAGRIFWMMGVHIIGSMRQWGNHATAFTGRRHFDDPYIFDKLYQFVEIKDEDEDQ